MGNDYAGGRIMKYLAKYLHRRGENPPYYRVVYADSINEAMKQAERYTRKGFLCVGVTTSAMESA